MTKRDVERRLTDLEGDCADSDGDVVEHLEDGGGVEVYYSDGGGGLLGPDGEHIPSERVEVLKEYDCAARIDVQDDADGSA